MNADKRIFEFPNGQRSLSIYRDICPKCAEKFGITKRVVKPDDKLTNEVISTGEQLYNIIAQIMWENQPPQS